MEESKKVNGWMASLFVSFTFKLLEAVSMIVMSPRTSTIKSFPSEIDDNTKGPKITEEDIKEKVKDNYVKEDERSGEFERKQKESDRKGKLKCKTIDFDDGVEEMLIINFEDEEIKAAPIKEYAKKEVPEVDNEPRTSGRRIISLLTF